MDECQQQFEDTQRALVTVLQQQTDHPGIAFRSLKAYEGHIPKPEGNHAA
jgi:hypothetical protein